MHVPVVWPAAEHAFNPLGCLTVRPSEQLSRRVHRSLMGAASIRAS
jgi:hypothetical protein